MVVVQVIVGGLLLGAIYALFSSGLTLIWGMMNFINFAHGEFVMLGMYVALLTVTWLGGGPAIFGLAAACALFVLGVGIYLSLIRHVIRGPMLAHKAEDEGVMVAEIIDGQKPHIDYNCIPWVIYTEPEIAWVGKNEQQLKAEGRAIKTGQFPMMANGRALGIGKTDGFIKMIADATTDELLGIHIISANASDLIAEAVVALEFKASSEDIGMISHPHPSLSEVMREAALAVQKRALNM